MKKYEVLEAFLKANKGRWFSVREINTHIKVTPHYLQKLSKIGFIKVKSFNEPMRTNYYSYNEHSGKWGYITKLINNGKNRNN